MWLEVLLINRLLVTRQTGNRNYVGPYVERLFDIVYKDNKQMLHKNIQRLFSVDKGAYYNTRQLLENMKQVSEQH